MCVSEPAFVPEFMAQVFIIFNYEQRSHFAAS